MSYRWAHAWYGDWDTLNLIIELNAYRARERLLDGHVSRSPGPDELDAIQDILRERGERFLPVARARPPHWMRRP